MAICNVSLLLFFFFVINASLSFPPATSSKTLPGDGGILNDGEAVDTVGFDAGDRADGDAADGDAGGAGDGFDIAGDAADGALKPGAATYDTGTDPSSSDLGGAGDEANGGEWRMLQRSIGISAMHMQLLPGNKLIIFDRTNFGPSNLSLPGRLCRADPSELVIKTDCTAHSALFDVSSASIRPLTILTDTWCSSGTLLPNGSLLQTGGYTDGDRAVRVFDPLSSPANWIEHPGYLAARRWYATNQLLPDGRVIIVGGRRQFNYEFFPRREDKKPLTRLDFLLETREGKTENNLYPFIHLLPDGTLFVFANTRAIILDAALRNVVRRLPPIPDDIPRSYPSSGSSVLLRLALPDPAPEVLICGGAPRGAFEAAINKTFVAAARTCGRIGPSRPDPKWEMEEMPMPRVMGNMVLLPTGDVVIINGAAAGTAGWELAREPVTNPVLYRPWMPEGSRFSVLNRSPVPRLYHSTALLDNYGRVLVAGSNPHVRYIFTNVTYPTELSMEAFYPPYMDEMLAALRPRITGGAGGDGSAAADLSYGEMVVLRFEVSMYRDAGAVEVVMVAPMFVTHAVSMNQRAVALPVERVVVAMEPVKYVAEVRAPPSPEIAPPGYYLLFVVHAGVPGEAVWVRIGAQ